MVPSKGLRLTLFKIIRETLLRVKCSFRGTASRDSETHVSQTSIPSPQFLTSQMYTTWEQKHRWSKRQIMISFQCPFRIYSGSDLPNCDRMAQVKVCHGRPTDRLDSSQREPGPWQLPAATTREAKTQLHLPLKQGTDSTPHALQPGAIKSVPVISCLC